MTIRHLKVFISVCETGSITKTAEMLNIAQPAVSQTIKELETYYSVELFLRINRRLVLTEHGKMLFIKAKEVINSFEEFESLAYELTLNPTLRIGASLTTAANTLDRIIDYVKTNHSNVSLYTYVNNANEIIERICNGDLDFGIIEGFSNNPSIASKELSSDKLVMVCGQDFGCPRKIKLEELTKLPLLLREKGSSSRDHLDRLCELSNVKIKPIMESISNHTIINSAISSHGVAILPKIVVQSYIDSKLLKEIEITNVQLENTSCLVWHKGKTFNRQLKDIFEFCHFA